MKKLIVVALVAAGCSPMTMGADGGSSSAGGSASAGGAAGGSSSAGGAAGGSSSAGGAAGGSSSAPLRIGSVAISQSTLEVAGQSFRSGFVLANFFEIPAGIPDCTRTTVGSCTISNCARAADAGMPPDGGRVGAGVVTLSGLADGGVTLMPMELGYQASISGAVFIPGGTIGVSTTGATVPAFTAQVTAPSGATLTAPICAQSTCPAISKAAGLTMTWSGGAGTVAIELLAGSEQVTCEYPAAAGTATIPPAVFASLPAGTASLFFNTVNATTIQAGPFPVKVTASESKLFQTSIAP
ncbi:MAG: hypothetical protein Q8L14_11775 [Myxococcales bacterium]|nr:hypothetical protein [Myxococcales bacterium]